MWIAVVTKQDINAALVIELLNEMVEILQSYFGKLSDEKNV